MWILLGAVAIITAILNVVWTIRNRDGKYFGFISLAFTAFTLCAFYSQATQWTEMEDWAALMDVMPSMSKALWILIVASVAINSISLFKKIDE